VRKDKKVRRKAWSNSMKKILQKQKCRLYLHSLFRGYRGA
jgi:hypothetical protein